MADGWCGMGVSPSLSSPQSASPARLASKRRVPPADPPPPGRTPPQATTLPPPAACSSFSEGQAARGAVRVVRSVSRGRQCQSHLPGRCMHACMHAMPTHPPLPAVPHQKPPSPPPPASLPCCSPPAREPSHSSYPHPPTSVSHLHMHPLTSVTRPPTAFAHLHMHPQDVQQLLHDAESVVQQLHPLRNLHVLIHRPAAQGGVDTERHQGRGRKQGAGLVGWWGAQS